MMATNALGKMDLDALLQRNIIGPEIYDQLMGQLGMAGNAWRTAPGGNTEGGAPVYEDTLNPNALARLQGYGFDWQGNGPANTGTLTAYDPSGANIGSFRQQDETLGQSLAKWGALAAAGFGGLGLAGLGPLGGMLGGVGGAGAAGGTSAGAIDAAALGLDGAAGFGSAAGGAAGGGAGLGGYTAGQTVAGLGELYGAGAGAAGGAGSFWGSLGLPASTGGAVGAALPLLGTGLQLQQAGKARDALQQSTDSANDLQKYMYDTTRGDNMPALQARNGALGQIQALLQNPNSLTSQPGYQFGMDQGTRALNNGAAARGMTYSGQQGKALQQFGQDYAGTKLDQSFNRLASLAGLGQAGAGTIADAGQNYAGQVGANTTAMGTANGALRIGQGNALADSINGLSAYGQRAGWWGG